MADVWISRKKWTCQYCNVTINDDVPSRTHHESGLRHKANVERALKDHYRKGEKERRDAELAKKEMARIEREALASYAKDQERIQSEVSSSQHKPKHTDDKTKVGEGRGGTSKHAKLEWKPKDKLAAYGSVIPLITEQDDETSRRLQEQEERKEKGFAGDWQTVEPPPPAQVSARSLSSSIASFTSERQQARSFKVREKKAILDDDQEEEDGLEEIKVKKRIKIETTEQKIKREEEQRAKTLPQWTPLKLQKSGTESSADQIAVKTKVEEDSTLPLRTDSGTLESHEKGSGSAHVPAMVKSDPDKQPESTATAKAEPLASGDDTNASETNPPKPEQPTNEAASSNGSSLFRKRKTGAGAGAKKVRALV